ncbi:MAG TPA: class I SAM-dependent methyltransferase [Kiritimatiellia bacterium]|nr:class I SAM-dependent methyltransferase [Kiritimatiellia bacterium]
MGRPSDIDARWEKAYRNCLKPDVRAALSGLGELQGMRGLVLASGLGCECVHLARRGATITGVDIAGERTELARELVRRHAPEVAIRFVTADAECLPFDDASFNFIFSRDVLMYGDWRKMMVECARVLQRGGRAVFMEALADHPAVKLYRRLGSDGAQRGFTRYLEYGEMGALSSTMRIVHIKAFYFLSLAAFYFLLRCRSVQAFRISLCLLNPLDSVLFRLIPALQRRAWRAVAVYKKE